jgi:hypothetical protein
LKSCSGADGSTDRTSVGTKVAESAVDGTGALVAEGAADGTTVGAMIDGADVLVGVCDGLTLGAAVLEVHRSGGVSLCSHKIPSIQPM